MQVEQAIFGSSNRNALKGYQLISKSSGVDRNAAQELCRWSPTQFASRDTDAWAISAFPVGEDQFAVTRTVLGGPEYSNRGGSQVITLILLMQNEQFAAYHYDAISVAKTAMTMGKLRLTLNWESAQLSPAVLPRRPIGDGYHLTTRQRGDSHQSSVLDKVSRLLGQSRRIAVVGLSDPFSWVGLLMQRLPSNLRKQFSFTTGLSPAIRRPFQAHFLPTLTTASRRTLESQRVSVIDVA